MLFRDLCQVLMTNVVIRVYGFPEEFVAYGTIPELERSCEHLMDKEVLSVSIGTNFAWDEHYIAVILDVVKGE